MTITIADLNNAKTDVDHIALVATSLELTAIDRFGHHKKTLAGAIASLSSIINRGAWAPTTAYAVKDIVLESGTWYICVVAHTSSGTFATDLPTKWRVFQGVTLGDLSAEDGAAILWWIQNGGAAVPRSVEAKLRDVYNARDFSVYGSGDETDVINAALAQVNALGGGTIEFTDPGYTARQIFWQSNVFAVFAPGTVFQAVEDAFDTNERFFNFEDIENFGIDGNFSVVRMNNEYDEGEQRHNIFITGCSDFYIRNLVTKDSGGDGVYIGRTAGAGTHCQRGILDNVRAVGNRRQGLSIVSADGLWVRGGSYENTLGADPQYGIDIEPNDSDDIMRGIFLEGVRSSGNYGGGLQIALTNYASTADVYVSIFIRGYTSENDGTTTPNRAPSGLRFGGASGGWAHTITGTIDIDGVNILEPVASGCRCDRWDAQKAPLIKLRNVVVVNPGSGSPANNEDKVGLAIWAGDNGGADFGNIHVTEFSVYDTRETAATYSPVYIYRNTGGSGVGHAYNVRLRDVMGVGFAPTSARGHLVTNECNIHQSSITYSEEQITDAVAANDPTVTRFYTGYTITADLAIELPPSSTNMGLEWRFRNIDGGTMSIKPNASDLIHEALETGKKLLLSRIGAECALRLGTDNQVRTLYCNDLAKRPEGYVQPPRVVYVSAIPGSVPSWAIDGDTAILQPPTVGEPIGWKLVSGVWQPMPDL